MARQNDTLQNGYVYSRKYDDSLQDAATACDLDESCQSPRATPPSAPTQKQSTPTRVEF